ncbi:hypothetical protein IAR50_004687 [Cryptococcus sp. DSM 104548]
MAPIPSPSSSTSDSLFHTFPFLTFVSHASGIASPSVPPTTSTISPLRYSADAFWASEVHDAIDAHGVVFAESSPSTASDVHTNLHSGSQRESPADLPAAFVIAGRDFDVTSSTQDIFSPPSPTGSNGLTHTGTIALACVLVVVSLICLGFVLWWLVRRKTRKRDTPEDVEPQTPVYAPIVPQVTLYLMPPQMSESRAGQGSPAGQDSGGSEPISPASYNRRGFTPGLPTPPKVVTSLPAITVTRSSADRARAPVHKFKPKPRAISKFEPITKLETTGIPKPHIKSEPVAKSDFLPASVTSRLSAIGISHVPAHPLSLISGPGRIISFDFESPPAPGKVVLEKAVPSRASPTSRVIRQGSESSSQSVEPICQVSSRNRPYRPTAKRTRRSDRNGAEPRPASKASPYREKAKSAAGALQLNLGTQLPDAAVPDRASDAIIPLSAPQSIDHAVESSAPEDNGTHTDTDLNCTISSATTVNMSVRDAALEPCILRFPSKAGEGELCGNVVEEVAMEDVKVVYEPATPLLAQEDFLAPAPSEDGQDHGEEVVTPVLDDLTLEDDSIVLHTYPSPHHTGYLQDGALLESMSPNTKKACIQLPSTFLPDKAVYGTDISFQEAEGDLLKDLDGMGEKSTGGISIDGFVTSTPFSSSQESLISGSCSEDSALDLAQETAEKDLIKLLEAMGEPRPASMGSIVSITMLSHEDGTSFDAAEESLLDCLEAMCSRAVKLEGNDLRMSLLGGSVAKDEPELNDISPVTLAEAEADLLSFLVAMNTKHHRALVLQDPVPMTRLDSTDDFIPIDWSVLSGRDSTIFFTELPCSPSHAKTATALQADTVSPSDYHGSGACGDELTSLGESLTADFDELGLQFLRDKDRPTSEPPTMAPKAAPSIVTDRLLGEKPDLLAAARAFLGRIRANGVTGKPDIYRHKHSKSVDYLYRESSSESPANVRGGDWQATPKSFKAVQAPASCCFDITRPSPASLPDNTIGSSQSTPEKEATGGMNVFFGELLGAHSGGRGNLRYRKFYGDVFDKLDGGMGNLFRGRYSWRDLDQQYCDSDSEVS